MHISRIDVHEVRNLRNATLDCHSLANIIYGQNGSGKTSLLEAIHLLGRGRSFRHRDLRLVVNHSAENLVVSASVESGKASRSHKLGVMRSRTGQFTARLDGSSLQTATQLAALIPIQLIDAHSFNLLEGGPLLRRQFVDWGVFHVEHAYTKLWRRFQKTLKQRNQLLRHGRIDEDLLRVWTAELVPLSEQVSSYRKRYIIDLASYVQTVAGAFDGLGELEIEFYRGWKDDASLAEIMEAQRQRDVSLGTTSQGAHKADVKVRVNGQPAADTLSRGQIKLLVYALKLAQATHYQAKTSESCVFLLDDLPAELDYHHRHQVIDCLIDLKCQFFVTGVDKGDFTSLVNNCEHTKFHVEQGVVRSD